MIAAVVERCAGIDVGKRFLKVCVMVGPLSEEPRFEIRKVDCVADQGERMGQASPSGADLRGARKAEDGRPF
jgi:hypothetical protein